MKLYHVFPAAGLTVLEPRITELFGKPRQVCLTALKPMALLYGTYTKEKTLYYTEYFPGAKEENKR